MDLQQKLIEEFENQKKELDENKLNLMVVGGTGAGKSTLINLVFGDELAEVGTGKPVTRGCNRIEKEGFPLVLFDTEGYEISDSGIDNSNFSQNVLPEIRDRQTKPLAEQIHLAWYCISVATNRLTPYDIENIETLNSIGLKVAIVFTQCDLEELDENTGGGVTSKEFKKVLEQSRIQNPIFETMNIEDNTLDLNKLINWSSVTLDNQRLRSSFISAQKANLTLKDEEADRLIKYFAGGAAVIGLSPIPGSDAPLLIAEQTAMLAQLSSIYEIGSFSNTIKMFMVTSLPSIAGRFIAGNLIKLIPGIGTTAGAAINATVAATITYSLGYGFKEFFRDAYIEILETGDLSGAKKTFNSIDFLSLFELYKDKGEEAARNAKQSN